MGAGAKETSTRLEGVFNQYRPGVNFTRPASLPVSTLHEHQSGVPDSRKEIGQGPQNPANQFFICYTYGILRCYLLFSPFNKKI